MKHARALLLSALLALVSMSGFLGVPAHASPAGPTSVGVSTPTSGAEFEDQVRVEINAARSRAGFQPVRFTDACVDRLATAWGQHIASTGIFAHRDQQQVLRKCDQSWAGENLIRGTGLTPRAIVDAWLASPTHRAVLLKSRASRAGLAVVIDGQGRQVGVLNVTDAR